MNAQEKWKELYGEWKQKQIYEIGGDYPKYTWRGMMRHKRREAALERHIARLERELAAAERTITTLRDRVWQLEAQEHNRDDGNEWEKEYYLRGMNRR